MGVINGDSTENQITEQNVLTRSVLENAPVPKRRGSLIELSWSKDNLSSNETVEMCLAPTETDTAVYDCTARRNGSGMAKYPIYEIEWRDNIIIHEETKWYPHYVRSRGEYSRAELEEVIRLGNQMVIISGGYRKAARELQEIYLRGRIYRIDQIENDKHVFPSIAHPHLLDIARLGVIPEYKGILPGGKRTAHYPYVSSDTEKIVKKLRKYINAGIMAVCESGVAGDRGQVISHSSSVAHKKLPDRTLSVDYRIIPDIRQINLGNPREDLYPVEVVRLPEIVSRILKLKRQYPTMSVIMANRDIASAFRRILLRPDLIRIFTTDIPGSELGRKADLFLGHLAMPFGWVASPAYFKLHTEAITALHRHYRPQQSLMSGTECFNSFMYVDDCMLIECPIGKRLSSCVNCWEWACRQTLGNDSTNEEKKRDEGCWAETSALLGFEVDTSNMSVRLPDEKVQQARALVMSEELTPGNYGVAVKTMQRLRGLRVHWLTCNLFWHCVRQPVDISLSHTSESGLMV